MKFLSCMLTFCEKLLLTFHGKGFGSFTVNKEVSHAYRLLKKNSRVVVDIGANEGNYTRALRYYFPNADIYVFEPSRYNFTKLETLFLTDKQIYLHNCALGDLNEVRNLYFDVPGSGIASLTQRDLSHTKSSLANSESVEVKRFEQVMSDKRNQYDIIDFVKIDVEGHELAVLNGMGALVFKCRLIQFEFGGANLDTRTIFKDFYHFFTSKNFILYRISPIGLIRIHIYSEFLEHYRTTNYLALNQKLNQSK